MEALMAIRRLETFEICPPPVDAINAGSDFRNAMRLAFIAGQRTAHYGPLASKAFAAFLAERFVNLSPQSGSAEFKSE
ncbi:MAG: hypothetical protein ACKOQM_00515 [Novosphingobium sp.]